MSLYIRKYSLSKDKLGTGTGTGGVTVPGGTQTHGDVALKDVGSEQAGVGNLQVLSSLNASVISTGCHTWAKGSAISAIRSSRG